MSRADGRSTVNGKQYPLMNAPAKGYTWGLVVPDPHVVNASGAAWVAVAWYRSRKAATIVGEFEGGKFAIAKAQGV